MRVSDRRLSLSPSDLSGFLACPHLTQLERAVTLGERKRPIFHDAHAELIRNKGKEHEDAYLAGLRAAGHSILAIPRYEDDDFDAETAQRHTEEAIRSGTHQIIYQPYLTDGRWRGFADFLERQDDGGYEPVDTKLARAAKPGHLLQLCFYAEQVARIQGRLPEQVHVELGSGLRETFRTAELMGYYRRVRSRFLAALEDRAETYPWPCEHCSICVWRRECHERRKADDHLVLVANLARSAVERLADAGIETLTSLGETPRGTEVEGMRPETFEGHRHQAALQLHHRRTGAHRFELLPDEAGRGLSLLPAPSPGDVWLDLEGHPFYEPARGLEYLFGYCHRDEAGELHYEAVWAKDRATEREAFERLVAWIVERRRRHPDLHVYHYANHERAALLDLMGQHGTCEDEIDDLLRGQVLVDLYRVTRQALRASVDSYSIKKIEALYGFGRDAEVASGGESTVLFERWLQCGDDSLLDAIERYNEEDCRSTAALHEWLVSLRPAELAWLPLPGGDGVSDEARTAADARAQVREQLLARSSFDGDPFWQLAHLLEYHRREARPQWWQWFDRLKMDEEELIEDTHAIAGLTLVGEPVPDKQSFVYTCEFPEQEHKIRVGSAVDPATEKAYDVVEVDDDQGVLKLRRGVKRAQEPLPRALVPGKPLDDRKQREAVLDFARSYLVGDGAHAALADVLERNVPRAELALPVPDAALTLDRSYLLVQGPPGTGKTWQGAKTAVALMRAGHRVGVTSLSHKAIHKLLGEIEREAAEQDFRFRGCKMYSKEDDRYDGRFISASSAWKDLLDDDLNLVAGTAWLFSREELRHHLHTLIIDEAGQFALADAIACGVAAHNLVLLGDPNQLPQVSQGAQPEAAKASVLKHLLGEHETVPPELGIFLAETRRLRPEPCRFTSEAYYQGRLASAPECARRSLAAGNGLFVIPVEHEGRSQSSREEAEAVAQEIAKLLGTPYTDARGTTRPLTTADVLVVAPYNAQVRALRSRVPPGVRVGTVDKFQGQEAPVVIVSFASSSGADAPRGIGFAFNSNRVNVATSRAQCRVVIVCAPRLLEAECRSVDQIPLLNAVCRFAELAGPASG